MRNENLWVENVVYMLDRAVWHSVRSHSRMNIISDGGTNRQPAGSWGQLHHLRKLSPSFRASASPLPLWPPRCTAVIYAEQVHCGIEA